MERKRVKSSNLHSVGHGAEGLEVQFHAKGCADGSGACGCGGGKVWQYAGVPADMHEALRSVASPGQYFHFYIKAAKHPDGQSKYPGREV